jgi:hypothetical protein
MKRTLLLVFFSLICLSATASVIIDFFGVPTCQECFEAEMMIDSLKYEVEEEVILNKYLLTESKNQELKLKYTRVYNVNDSEADLVRLFL